MNYEILSIKNILGESPLWNKFDKKFYWVDILKKEILSYDFNKIHTRKLDMMPTFICMHGVNTLFCAMEDGLGIYDLNTDKFSYEIKIDASRVRFNDGKLDRDGVLYIGTMDREEKERIGSIYKYINNSLELVVKDIGISNGISFSNDNNTMYYSDSMQGKIFSIKDGITQTIKAYDVSSPDGSTVDAENKYYSCLWGGSRIDIFDENNVINSINIPVINPTCCAYGGDNMNLLFITSASILHTDGNNGSPLLIKNPYGYKGVIEPIIKH